MPNMYMNEDSFQKTVISFCNSMLMGGVKLTSKEIVDKAIRMAAEIESKIIDMRDPETGLIKTQVE